MESSYNFINQFKPDDFVAIISLLACYTLVALGHNSFLGSIISTITGFYFGRKTITQEQ